MSVLEAEKPDLLIDLCRYYCLCDRALPEALALADRGVALAELGYRHRHLEHRRPAALELEGLRRSFDDLRVRGLPVRRRQLLLFVTGAALARLTGEPQEARQLLARALEVSRRTWVSSRWQPWEGPRPEELPRRAVDLIADEPGLSGDEPDPSGDPVELAGRTVVEGVLERPGRLAEFASASQILDGLNHWEAVVQDHLGLALGQFRRTGRPDLEHLAGPTWSEPVSAELEEVFQAAVA